MLAIKAVFFGPRYLIKRQDNGEDRNVTLCRIEATSAVEKNKNNYMLLFYRGKKYKAH